DAGRKLALQALFVALSFAVVKRATWARPMANIWRTGVSRGASLGRTALKKKNKRKPRKTAEIRAAKQARAARRVATKSTDTTATVTYNGGNGCTAAGTKRSNAAMASKQGVQRRRATTIS
ncbi:hypothetical protein PPTG_20450, partial [Phytophthora nicotianae INRA-310]